MRPRGEWRSHSSLWSSYSIPRCLTSLEMVNSDGCLMLLLRDICHGLTAPIEFRQACGNWDRLFTRTSGTCQSRFET